MLIGSSSDFFAKVDVQLQGPIAMGLILLQNAWPRSVLSFTTFCSAPHLYVRTLPSLPVQLIKPLGFPTV